MTRRGFLGATTAFLGLGGCAVGAPRLSTEERYPPIGAFTTVEGLRVHYVAKGSGPPVVLIHGASGNLRDFTFSMVDKLAERGYRAVAFDRPGLGYTDRPAERGYDPAVQARVLHAAARAVGVERAIVVGHSWGGAVATAWALAYPADTAGVLSLAGATYPWGTGVSVFYDLAATRAFSPLTRALANAYIDEDDPTGVMRRLFAPNDPPPGYGAYIGVGLALRPDVFRYNALDLENLDRILKAQAPNYPELAMPVEALHGEADDTVLASVHSVPLAEDVRDGRVTLLPGVGHMVHHAAEAEALAAIGRLGDAAV